MRRWRRVATAAAATAVALSCATLQFRSTARRELWGFTAPWDARSLASALGNGGRLDALVTGWVALDSTSGLPLFDLFPDSLSGAGTSGVSPARRMMLVTSWLGDRFHPSS